MAKRRCGIDNPSLGRKWPEDWHYWVSCGGVDDPLRGPYTFSGAISAANHSSGRVRIVTSGTRRNPNRGKVLIVAEFK